MGEWETIPCDGQFEIRRTTSVGTAEGEKGRGTWHVVRDSERMSAEFAGGRVEIDGNVERVRQDGEEVLCAERAAVTVRMD